MAAAIAPSTNGAAVRVMRSASISENTEVGLGSEVSTTVPPAHSTPRIPGELMVKLCAIGSTTNMRVSPPSSQMRADSRTEYR